jgi:hypothetical protein
MGGLFSPSSPPAPPPLPPIPTRNDENVQRRKAAAHRETDPNTRANIRILIRQLEQRLRKLQEELKRAMKLKKT